MPTVADEFVAAALRDRRRVTTANPGAHYITSEPEWVTLGYFEDQYLPTFLRASLSFRRPIRKPPIQCRPSLHYQPPGCEVRWNIPALVWPTTLVPETLPDALDSQWSGVVPPSKDMLSKDDTAYPLQWRATLTGSEFHIVWAGVLHKARFDTGCTEMAEPHVMFPRGMPEQATQTVMDLLRRISAARTPEQLYTFHAAGERCGICRRKLRDALSRASGIGPDCADELGWNQHKIAELRQRVWRDPVIPLAGEGWCTLGPPNAVR